jgi:hypothetical protein
MFVSKLNIKNMFKNVNRIVLNIKNDTLRMVSRDSIYKENVMITMEN